MKQAKELLPLVQDQVLRNILKDIIDDLARIQSIPAVTTTSDITKIRDAVNKITGKI